jgi:beta-galactosidase
MKHRLSLVFILLAIAFLHISVTAGMSSPKIQGEKEQVKGKFPSTPFVGAQVFIEPGQSPEEVDHWFKMLKEHNMTFCRIRMFESYMHDEKGNWDFSLFDVAFRAADKYGIKVYATIFPYTEKTDIGGFKFPRDEEHLKSIALYIEKLVTHFKEYNSLFGWVLINEPGTGGRIPQNEFTEQKRSEWLEKNPPKETTSKGYPVLVDLTDESFFLDYETWFLNWIAEEIKKHDHGHDIHVNTHAIFNNIAEYDFPAWRKFLTSLGGSAHASWHFNYFNRQQYAVAMSANSEIIHSGAGDLPWIMTELQGGNNTYSGGNPMCPTKEEIAQWLWIIAGTEGKGSIFWTLNPRSSGIEAGEWALLDFQDQPSDRMVESSKVAATLQKNEGLFGNAKKVESGISILYARESLWGESKLTLYGSSYQARNSGGVIKSALGYFEALSEMGISANMKEINEFDFSKEDYTGEAIILSHQISLPGWLAGSLEQFVSRGGKLIVDGLTGYFDENMHNTMKTGFDFKSLFGGNVSEFKLVENLFKVEVEKESIPAHLWKGYLVAEKGTLIYDSNSDAIGIRHKTGKGEVLWVPSLLGLGSRMENDYRPLQNLLAKELKGSLDQLPVYFSEPKKNVLMKTLYSGDAFITIIVNKNENAQTVQLKFNSFKGTPEEIYPATGSKFQGNSVHILPEETKVVVWKP